MRLLRIGLADGDARRLPRIGDRDDLGFDGSDLAGADFSNARCSAVDLRGARLDGLRGMVSLAGATIGVDQVLGLAPALAQALGLHVSSDERETTAKRPEGVERGVDP